MTQSQSTEEDSDAENEKEEDKKTDEEKALAKEKEKEKESGASTKASTPSGRPKHTDALKKPSAIGRKRIGSPNLSDASGTDTSRKKPKHAPHSVPSPSGLAVSSLSLETFFSCV